MNYGGDESGVGGDGGEASEMGGCVGGGGKCRIRYLI